MLKWLESVKSALGLLALLVLLQGCFAMDKNADKAGSAGSTGVTGIRFATVNSAIIQPKCLSCHTNNARGINFRTYEEVAMYVLPGRADFSVLYEQVSTGLMPQGGPSLTNQEIQLIYDWIDQGALP